jgi:hypothetical protein
VIVDDRRAARRFRDRGSYVERPSGLAGCGKGRRPDPPGERRFRRGGVIHYDAAMLALAVGVIVYELMGGAKL